MKRIAILLACVTVAGTQVAWAQASARTVTGRVFDDTTGCPLPKASVTVLGGSQRATTNAEGRYRLLNPPAAAFSLQVMLEGYLPRRTDSVTVVNDTSARVDFSLKRSGTAAGKVSYPPARCHLEPTGARADSSG